MLLQPFSLSIDQSVFTNGRYFRLSSRNWNDIESIK